MKRAIGIKDVAVNPGVVAGVGGFRTGTDHVGKSTVNMDFIPMIRDRFRLSVQDDLV